MKKWIPLLLAVALTGCSMPTETPQSSITEQMGTQQGAWESPSNAAVAGEPGSLADIDVQDLFSDRDRRTQYTADAAIVLDGSTAKTDSGNVNISGGTVTITAEGVYEISGTLTDGSIVVDASKSDKVQLVLNNTHITSAASAAVYVKQADKVFLTLVGESSLENGGSFAAVDENDLDAAVYAKDDLTVNGTGSLHIVSPAGHGISAKDELTVTGGTLTVVCAGHGLDASDSIAIESGSFVLKAGKDGIHGENNDEAAMGYVYIAGGSFDIDAQGDGISAGSSMQLDGGSYTIVTGGGAVNGKKQTSDGWGGMGGYGGGRSHGPGGFGGQQESTAEDTASIKGIKAGGELLINDGSFTIDSADDAVHSNAGVTVNGGSFTIATGDDGFHADEALTICAGSIAVTESYEGLEGLSVTVSGGEITLKSSDDGINAAGGTDGSGFGGSRGGDRFGGRGGASDSFIQITGGRIYMNASGDGIDSNGTLTISGGHTTVCGPTQGDTAVLDYDATGIITGGTFIGTGSFMMAQTFSDSRQGVIALQVGDQSAGTPITLADGDGKRLIDDTPALDYAIIILSTPEMVKGERYTVTVGSLSDVFEAS